MELWLQEKNLFPLSSIRFCVKRERRGWVSESRQLFPSQVCVASSSAASIHFPLWSLPQFPLIFAYSILIWKREENREGKEKILQSPQQPNISFLFQNFEKQFFVGNNTHIFSFSGNKKLWLLCVPLTTSQFPFWRKETCWRKNVWHAVSLFSQVFMRKYATCENRLLLFLEFCWVACPLLKIYGTNIIRKGYKNPYRSK